MREIVSLLEEKIKFKLVELSRMEKELAIAKSIIANDIRDLYKVLNIHFPLLIDQCKSKESDE